MNGKNLGRIGKFLFWLRKNTEIETIFCNFKQSTSLKKFITYALEYLSET